MLCNRRLCCAAADGGAPAKSLPITSHLLDTSMGRPASSLPISLHKLSITNQSTQITLVHCAAADGVAAAKGSPITSHVLDTSMGKAASGVPISLHKLSEGSADAWELIASGHTNSDGRLGNLLTSDHMAAGTYRFGTCFVGTSQPLDQAEQNCQNGQCKDLLSCSSTVGPSSCYQQALPKIHQDLYVRKGYAGNAI